MKFPRSSVAVALVAVVVGCSSSDYSVGPEQDLPVLPRLDIQGMDCQLSDTQCAIILAGIDYLQGHANPMCKIIGNRAQERYDAASGEGFRGRSQEGSYHMSVDMTSPTSYSPLDGYTNVYPNFWSGGNTSAAATGGLLAHEEAHHKGQDNQMHQTGLAASMQDMCLNPQG